MWTEFLQKVWAIAEPTILAAIALILAAGLALLKKYLDARTQAKAIAETVAAVDILSTNTTGAEKKAVVEELLDADPRVGDYTDNEIEAAVRMLPPKPQPACAPDTP